MENPLLTEYLTGANGLATELSVARSRAGLTGRDLATILDWPESKVSRIANGRQIPTEDEVRQWAEAVGLDDIEAEALVELAHGTTATALSWRARLRVGKGTTQASYRTLFRDTAMFQFCHPAMIPGQLQTPGYAAWIIGHLAEVHGAPVDVERSVAARLARARHFDDPTKTFHLVLSEQLLGMANPGREIMVEQLDHLTDFIHQDRANVRLGILPNTPGLPLLISGFEVYDRELAIVEDAVREHSYFGADEEVAAYAALADRLMAEALEGPEAVARIKTARRRHRSA